MAQNEQPYAVFRFEKIKTYQQFAVTIQHANRELDVPNADPSIKNGYYKQTSLEEIEQRCEQARTRKDNVLGYDLLFTASPEFFSSGKITGEEFKTPHHLPNARNPRGKAKCEAFYGWCRKMFQASR